MRISIIWITYVSFTYEVAIYTWRIYDEKMWTAVGRATHVHFIIPRNKDKKRMRGWSQCRKLNSPSKFMKQQAKWHPVKKTLKSVYEKFKLNIKSINQTKKVYLNFKCILTLIIFFFFLIFHVEKVTFFLVLLIIHL